MAGEASEYPIPTRIGNRGTFVIPARLRHELGLEDGTRVTAEKCDGGVLIKPAPYVEFSEEERARLIAESISAYAALREDPEAWAEEQREHEGWERIGVETWPKEPWPDDEQPSHGCQGDD